MEPRTKNIRRLYQGGPAVVVADTDGNPMTDLDDYFGNAILFLTL